LVLAILKNMSSRLQSRYANESTYYKETSFNKFCYIDYDLTADGAENSLHSLSMKFGVSVTDLKRINNLQNDREIFALKAIRIPIKPNSLLSEQYANKLKYTDQVISRLSSATNADIYNQEGGENQNDETTSNEDPTETENKESNLMNSSDELITNVDHVEDDQRPLLAVTSKQDLKQVKEAKRFFKKFDTNLNALKHQNNEILTNVIPNVNNLIPMHHMAYSITSSRSNSSKNFFFINFNVRDSLIIACCIIVLFPLGFLIYELYYNDHKSLP
jgi:hypothetical protein